MFLIDKLKFTYVRHTEDCKIYEWIAKELFILFITAISAVCFSLIID